jgi:uncharacterized protein YndB with AHSA1/START domain
VTDVAPDGQEIAGYHCRTEIVVPASVDDVWAALVDLAEWTRWWVVVRVEPIDPDASTVLRPGYRFRILANRPGGPTRSWIVEVLDVQPKERIALLYAEGDMYGRTSWELSEVPGGIEVAYVYEGVRPLDPEMAASWRRWGSGSHECNMRLATLPGLARYVTGEPLDDAWSERVKAAVGECIAALPELQE